MIRIPDSLRVLPTRRLALVLAVTAPVWLTAVVFPWGNVAGVAVVIGVVMIVVADIVMLPRVADITVTRTLPETTGLGDTAHGTYRIRSAWATPVHLTVVDSMPMSVARFTASLSVVTAPNSTTTIPISIRASRRGVWNLGPVAMRILAPLGLVQRTVVAGDSGSLTVAPSLAEVHRFRLLAMQHQLRQAGVRAMRRRGEGNSFANLREYSVGDDPRVIDWKHSARRGKLITREFTAERGQTVIIVIDSGRMMTQATGDASRFELALSAALVLSAVATASGDRIGLMVFDDRIRAYVPPTAGVAATRAIRDALIVTEPSLVEPDYASGFAALATRQRSRALIVFFTDVIDARASRSLIANTSSGMRRHLLLVVALRNDALFQAALPAPDVNAEGLFRSAAAEELILARGEALQAMRRGGAAVVDVSPATASAAVVNRYLEIKSRGAL